MKKQRHTSMAAAVLDRFGPEVCREYAQRPTDGCELSVCEHGHSDCSHIKGGPCLKELNETMEALK